MSTPVETGDRETSCAESSCAGQIAHQWHGDMRYLMRQPILDLEGRVHGYELRVSSPDASGAYLDGPTRKRRSVTYIDPVSGSFTVARQASIAARVPTPLSPFIELDGSGDASIIVDGGRPV